VEQQALEAWLAAGLSVEAIARQVGKDPSTISYWMKKFGLAAPLRSKHAARSGLEREELEALVAEGLSIADIAQRVERSKATVRHWLSRYGLKTERAGIIGRPRQLQDAWELGEQRTVGTCLKHGVTEFVLEGRGYFRCKACRSAGVSNRRRQLKQILVREAGGRCAICGYDRCVSALHFHHVDPTNKRIHVSADGRTLALKALREEANKCILLCANCHAEVEAGLAVVPLEFRLT
jgi:transposase